MTYMLIQKNKIKVYKKNEVEVRINGKYLCIMQTLLKYLILALLTGFARTFFLTRSFLAYNSRQEN